MTEIVQIIGKLEELREWYFQTYSKDMNLVWGYNQEDKRHEVILTFRNKDNVELFKRTRDAVLPQYKKMIREQM